MFEISKDITFSELSKLWLEKTTVCASFGWKHNISSLVKHCNKYIGDKKITEIKPWDIDVIIYELAQYNPNIKKPASKKFLSNLVNCLQRIFEFAIENEITYHNPAKNKKKEIPKNSPKKEVDALTREQQQCVIDVEHRAKLAAVLMMFTGIRTGELLALEWSDIDFENKTLSVNKRACRQDGNNYIVIPNTKNGKSRLVSVPEAIISYLRKQLNLASCELVCPSLDFKLQTLTQWKRLWESYQNSINYYCYKKKCKENNEVAANYYSPVQTPRVIKKFNPHQLRHTYATLLYTSGVDVLTAQKLLGHSNVQTTLSIYTHLDEKYLKLNITKFDDFIKSDFNIKNI